MINKNIDNKSQLDKKGVIQSGSLAGKSLWVAIWFLAIPILIQQILVAFVGLADKMFAGGLPEAIVLPSMDAIGIGSYVGWFISIAVSGIGIGSQALIARAMGSGNMEQGKSVLGQSISLAFFWGIVISVGLWLFAKPLGELCQLSESAQIYLVQYVHVIAIGMPACAVMQTGAMCLHGSGDTIRPAVVMLFVNIVNVFFSWIFSGADLQFGGYNITNPFSLDYHVIGIAIGTSISYLVGALLIILVLARGIGSFKVQLSYLSLDIAIFWRISKIGIPSFFEGLSMWLANLFVLQFIGQIAARLAVRSGSEKQVIEGLQGAHVIAVQWESFSFLPGFAIGIASGTLAGQYLGANNIKEAKKAIKLCTGLAMIFMSLIGLVMMFAGSFLTSLISTEPVHLELVPKLLFIAGATQIVFAFMMVLRQSLRGLGDTLWTLLITSFSSWCVRLPCVWFLGIHLDYGLVGIWYALCGEMAIRGFLFFLRFKQGGWVKSI